MTFAHLMSVLVVQDVEYVSYMYVRYLDLNHV